MAWWVWLIIAWVVMSLGVLALFYANGRAQRADIVCNLGHRKPANMQCPTCDMEQWRSLGH